MAINQPFAFYFGLLPQILRIPKKHTYETNHKATDELKGTFKVAVN